jgi:hypothetical protein
MLEVYYYGAEQTQDALFFLLEENWPVGIILDDLHGIA